MPDTERPQIYLVTPPEFELDVFPDRLAAVLDGLDVACVRLALATRDEDRVARAADALRVVAHARDVAIVIESHLLLVERHGLDGVHLTDGARTVRHARKELGSDAIVGAFCRTSRHDGMNAGEAGADYVAFGPLGLHRLEAACLPGNDASANLLLKAGFTEEGYAKAYLKINGDWRDHRLFGLVTRDPSRGRPREGLTG